MSDLKLNEDMKLPEMEYDLSTIAMSNAAKEAHSFYQEHRFGDGAAWFSAAERLAYRALIREDQLLAALRESAAEKQRIAELTKECVELKQHVPRWIAQAKGATHYEGCWQDHRNCALSRIAELERENREKDERFSYFSRLANEQKERFEAESREKDEKIAHLRIGAMCPVCVGNPISDKPCICGGSADAHDAYSNVLKDLLRAESEAGELREQVARLEGK